LTITEFQSEISNYATYGYNKVLCLIKHASIFLPQKSVNSKYEPYSDLLYCRTHWKVISNENGKHNEPQFLK